MAAASLLAVMAAAPTLVRADDQRPPRDNNGRDDNGKRPGKGERDGQGDHGGDRGGRERGQQHGGQQQGQQQKGPEDDRGRQKQGQQQDRQRDQGERFQKQFGGGNRPQDNPNAGNPMQKNQQRQQPVVNTPDRGPPQQQQKPDSAPQPPKQQQAQPQQPPQQKQQPFDGKPKNFNDQFGGKGNDRNGNDRNANDRNKPDNSKQFGGRDRDRDQQPGPGSNPQPNRPVVDKPGNRPQLDDRRGPFGGGGQPALNRPGEQKRPLSADEAKRRFESMRGQRKEVKIDGGKGTVIEEPGNRRIIKENNRIVIQHDETERLRRVAPNARFQKGKGGTNVSIIERPGGIKVYSETDQHGQLLRRYRRGPDGRDVIIIDNRRRGRDNGKDFAKGVGIGIGVVAGAAILHSILDVPPPRVRIPREKYIVDYGRASDEDVYEALSAPPVDEFEDRYTLDEIRATAPLRDRMRRIDLDDITFEFGSWDVDPSQYRKLERIARGMNRIIDRNPNEVFMIEGYTDAVGSEEDNLSLSDRRAESVATVLTEEFGVPFENLTTQGYGEEYLKVPTQAAERLNRRVAVRRITPLLARD